MMNLRKRFKLVIVAIVLFGAPALADAPNPAPALSKLPKLIRFVEAKTPPALEQRRAVDVTLGLDVDEAGVVQKVEVTEPSGDGFDEAAAEAARHFVFEPGEYEGHPVPVHISYKYRFFFKEPPPPPPPPTPSLLAASSPSAALVPPQPTVPLAGVVLRKGDRTPLEGLSVVLDAGSPSAVTDAEGRFQFDTVPTGVHTVHLRGPGITPADGSLTLNAGKRLDVTYYVTAKERYTSRVRAQRVIQETVEQTLQTEEIRRIPGTQGDTLKAVQNLPGVARAPFGNGMLIVWGSAPQDTRAYVDGVRIPVLYHFGGLRSTFNGELVQSLTFMPGGYNAEYGRGLGGVVEVDSRRPRTDALHGFVQLDLVDGSFLIESPLGKNLSLAIGARRSWIDVFLPLFTTSNFQLSPVYWDYQANLHWRASPRDEVDVMGFGSDDTLKLILKQPDPTASGGVASHTYFHRGVVRWLHRFEHGATAESTASAGYDVPFQFATNQGSGTQRVDLRDLSYNLRSVVHAPVTPWLSLRAGLDYEGNRWGPLQVTFGAVGPPREGDPGGFGAGGGGGPFAPAGGLATDDITIYTNTAALFIEAPLALLNKRLVITPQLRVDVMSFAGYGGTPDAFSQTYVEPEPRLSARAQILPRFALKLAAGLYHQPPATIDFSKVFGNPALGPESSFHLVAGFDWDPTPSLHLEMEGFYKSMWDLIVRGERVGDPPLVNDGVGRVYGGEVLVRQQLSHNFFGWVSYTLSRSERRDHADLAWRRFQYDQTHILTAVASYLLPRGYQVGLRFRYVTGSPYTPVAGTYYDASSDRYSPLWGGVYSGRLGSFNELDIRFDKSWTFDRWKLSFYLDLENVYNRQNPEGVQYNFDYSRTQVQTGLPILPVLGIRGDF